MNLAQTIALIYADSTPGSQAGAPDSRGADSWIKNFLDDKERRQNEVRQELQRVMDGTPKEIASANNPYLPKENLLERAAGGGRYLLVDSEGLLLSAWPTYDQAATAQRANPSKTRIKDRGVDHDSVLGPKPKAVSLADTLRMDDARPTRRYNYIGYGSRL